MCRPTVSDLSAVFLSFFDIFHLSSSDFLFYLLVSVSLFFLLLLFCFLFSHLISRLGVGGQKCIQAGLPVLSFCSFCCLSVISVLFLFYFICSYYRRRIYHNTFSSHILYPRRPLIPRAGTVGCLHNSPAPAHRTIWPTFTTCTLHAPLHALLCSL